jgi:hypothetical protein
LTGFGVERGVERKRAMTVVLKTVSLGPSGRERQDWIEAVQGLDSALFINAKDCGIDRRLQIQADDVGSLGFKIRVVAGHVAPKAVRLQSGFGQNTGHSGMVGAKFGRQLPCTPVRRTILGFLPGRGQNPRFEPGTLLAGYLATMTAEKTSQALLGKAFAPKSYRVDAASQLPTYRPLRPTASNQEDNLGPLHILCSRATRSDHLPKSSTLWRRKNQSLQHRSFIPEFYIRSQ